MYVSRTNRGPCGVILLKPACHHVTVNVRSGGTSVISCRLSFASTVTKSKKCYEYDMKNECKIRF